MKHIAQIYIKDQYGENHINAYKNKANWYLLSYNLKARLIYGASPFKLKTSSEKEVMDKFIDFLKRFISNRTYTSIHYKDRGCFNDKKTFIINMNKEIFISIRKGYMNKLYEIIESMYYNDSMKWKEEYNTILEREDN